MSMSRIAIIVLVVYIYAISESLTLSLLQGLPTGQWLGAPSPSSLLSMSFTDKPSILAAAKPARRARKGRVNFILNSLVVKSEESRVVIRRVREVFVLKCLSREAC